MIVPLQGGVRMNTNSISMRRATFDIKNGPNRSMIVDAFKYAHDRRSRVVLDFIIMVETETSSSEIQPPVLKPLETRRVFVEGLKHRDDTGYGFLIEGKMGANFKAPYDGSIPIGWKKHHFVARYDAQSREGTITFYFD